MTPDNMPLPLRTRLFCSSFEEPKKQSTKQQKKKKQAQSSEISRTRRYEQLGVPNNFSVVPSRAVCVKYLCKLAWPKAAAKVQLISGINGVF